MRAKPRDSTWPEKARTCDGVEYLLRPLEPHDAPLEREFISSLSPESRYLRFLHAIGNPASASVAPLMAAERHQAMSLAATLRAGDRETIIGLATCAAKPGATECEFGVAVADRWQCSGIGTTLMRRLFELAAAEGYRVIYGDVLASNAGMIDLARHVGLEVDSPAEGQATLRVWRRLN